MPPVRLAPREELAAAARVAPLLRAAADLSRWADEATARFAGDALAPADALAAAAALELTPAEVEAAWQVVVATGLREADSDNGAARLDQQDASEVLGAWDAALAAILDAEELDGLATALYTVGAPVRIDALFEAYTAAAGGSLPRPAARRRRPGRPGPGPGRGPPGRMVTSRTRRRRCRAPWRRWPTWAWSSSAPRRPPAA